MRNYGCQCSNCNDARKLLRDNMEAWRRMHIITTYGSSVDRSSDLAKIWDTFYNTICLKGAA